MTTIARTMAEDALLFSVSSFISLNDPGIFADRLNDGPGRCSAFYAVTMPAGEKIDASPTAFCFAGAGAPGSSYNNGGVNRTPGSHAPGLFLFGRQNV